MSWHHLGVEWLGELIRVPGDGPGLHGHWDIRGLAPVGISDPEEWGDRGDPEEWARSSANFDNLVRFLVDDERDEWPRRCYFDD